MEKRHILISGDRGIGKSFLIQRILKEKGMPVSGFRSKSESRFRDDGFHDIFLHPASEADTEWKFTKENQIGSCNSKIHNVDPEVFETLGVQYLNEIREDSIILMDELGFMETSSPKFMERVLELFRGDQHILAAIKPRHDIPFLEEIRACPKCMEFCLTAGNRDEICEKVSGIVKNWGSSC